jgi:hypothetical protein
MEISDVHMFFSAELADAFLLFAGEFAGKSAARGKAARDGDNFGGNSLFAADALEEDGHARDVEGRQTVHRYRLLSG